MNCEIVGMIYRSVRYLDFMVDQLERHGEGLPWVIVANDATDEVMDRLRERGTPYREFHSRHPAAPYINRVYECVNWIYETTPAEWVLEVQSDMAFSPGWVTGLIREATPARVPVSRLVHPFPTVSFYFSPERDFGAPPDFREPEWLKFAGEKAEMKVELGGFYCPRLMQKRWFLDKTGGFPEGNLAPDGSIAAALEEGLESGDAAFFRQSGAVRVTVFDSMVYHLQEGEMLDK